MSGHVFIFLNRRRTQVKLLMWTWRFTIVHRRLERGRFASPARVRPEAARIEFDAHDRVHQGGRPPGGGVPALRRRQHERPYPNFYAEAKERIRCTELTTDEVARETCIADLHAEQRSIGSQPASTEGTHAEPVCRAGTHPLCICESDDSYNCRWLCGSW